MKNIGILGGTFNPIHLGHTLPAKVVAAHLSLEKVLLIPANIPPHKNAPNISAANRATMVKLACENEPLFTCDERELKRDGYSYTVDTLTELTGLYPNTRLYFIMGLDSLLTFTQWHKYQDILKHCHLVVNTRPNYHLSTTNLATKYLIEKHQVNSLSKLNEMRSGGILFIPDILPSISPLEVNQLNMDVSSSEIRQRLLNNQDCKHLLCANVLAFINKNRLYR